MRSQLTKKIQVIVESVSASYRRNYPFIEKSDLEQACYLRWMDEEADGKKFETNEELAYLKQILSNHLKDVCKGELKHQEIRRDLTRQARATFTRSRRVLGEDE